MAVTIGSVLVVEDDGFVNELYAEQMRLQGLEVHQAGSIEEARRAYARLAPEVVCVDGRLPDGSGAKLTVELVRSGARVILLTNDQDMYESPPPGVTIAVLKVKVSPLALAAAVRGLLITPSAIHSRPDASLPSTLG